MTSVFRRHRLAAALIALFVVLGVTYSLVTPIFEASDELTHYPVVQYISTHWDLPIQRPGVKTLWEQEGSQPPLYYLACAALTSWIDTGDLQTIRDRNPHAKLGIPLDQDNKNMILHSEAEAYPWHGTVLAVHLLRLFGVVLGAISVILSYGLAREVWPETPHVALLAAALVALNPMFLFISASVNNDNLIIPLVTGALWLLVRAYRYGLTVRRSVLLSVLAALAALTKISGLTLLPIVGLGFAIIGWRSKQWGPAIRAIGILVLAILVIDGSWYVRNITLYGELLGTNTQVAIAGGRRIALWDLIREESYGFWVSYWALFGSVNILADPAVYWFYGCISIVGASGMALWLIRAIRARAWDDLIVPALLFGQVALNLIGLIRWTLTTYASQGRLMFPVIGVLSLFTARGFSTLVPARFRLPSSMVVSGALMAIAFASPFRYIAPTYAPPPVVTQIPDTAIPVGANFDGIELLAVDSPLATVSEGGWVPITLYWRASSKTDTNLSLFLHALGRNNQEIGNIDSYPGAGALPTTRFQLGVIVKDSYRVPLVKHFDTPTRVRMLIGMGIYSPQSYTVIDATKDNGERFGNVVIDAGVAYPLDPGACASVRSAGSRMLGSVGMFAQLWADTTVKKVHPGDPVSVSLFWDRLADPGKDWTVFVHLINDKGDVVAQADSPPLNNDLPTSLWRLPCEINDVHSLRVPADLPPGAYRLLIGLYDANDPAYSRAAALDVGGSPYPDNAIPVGEVQVEASQ